MANAMSGMGDLASAAKTLAGEVVSKLLLFKAASGDAAALEHLLANPPAGLDGAAKEYAAVKAELTQLRQAAVEELKGLSATVAAEGGADAEAFVKAKQTDLSQLLNLIHSHDPNWLPAGIEMVGGTRRKASATGTSAGAGRPRPKLESASITILDPERGHGVTRSVEPATFTELHKVLKGLAPTNAPTLGQLMDGVLEAAFGPDKESWAVKVAEARAQADPAHRTFTFSGPDWSIEVVLARAGS